MIAILDASTLINLCNGEVFGKVLAIPSTNFLVSSVVRDESKSVAAAIDAAVKAGSIALVDDAIIPVSDFHTAKGRWGLGDGETECILAASAMSCAIGLDDMAARNIAIRQLGEARVFGSLGLLRLSISRGLVSEADAYSTYQLMRSRGGYLPVLTAAQFSRLDLPRF